MGGEGRGERREERGEGRGERGEGRGERGEGEGRGERGERKRGGEERGEREKRGHTSFSLLVFLVCKTRRARELNTRANTWKVAARFN